MAARRNNDGTRRDDIPVFVFLLHRQGIFSCRDVDTEADREIGAGLYGFVQTRVLAFIFTSPHPVG
ncbi:hypothetical protein D3C86_2102520 [compost metagenome]